MARFDRALADFLEAPDPQRRKMLDQAALDVFVADESDNSDAANSVIDSLFREIKRTDGAVNGALFAAALQRRNHVFLDHGEPNLDIRRVHTTDASAAVSDLSIRVRMTADRAIIAEPTATGEQVRMIVVSAIQLFVNNDQPEDAKRRLHSRGFDFRGLDDRC